MMGRLKNESGFALILTLVVTALMVAVVVEMIHQVYVDTSISRGFRDRQQASVLAESGVMAVKTALAQNVDPALLQIGENVRGRQNHRWMSHDVLFVRRNKDHIPPIQVHSDCPSLLASSISRAVSRIDPRSAGATKSGTSNGTICT